MIDTVLAWNHEAVPNKFDDWRTRPVSTAAAAAFVEWLITLKRASASKAAGAARRDGRELPRLVRAGSADFTTGTNPRPATASDYERLFKQAM
jgi:alcohol dehydrogenase class IV